MRIFEWLLAALMIFTFGFGVRHCAQQKLEADKVVNGTPISWSGSLFGSGYNFVELFDAEVSIRWEASHIDMLTSFGPRRFEALYMYQTKHHYDIAAEIPLSWDYHHVFPNYAIWYDYELTSQFGRETWIAAEVMGPIIRIFRDPYSSIEKAKAAVMKRYNGTVDNLVPSGKRFDI